MLSEPCGHYEPTHPITKNWRCQEPQALPALLTKLGRGGNNIAVALVAKICSLEVFRARRSPKRSPGLLPRTRPQYSPFVVSAGGSCLLPLARGYSLSPSRHMSGQALLLRTPNLLNPTPEKSYISPVFCQFSAAFHPSRGSWPPEFSPPNKCLEWGLLCAVTLWCSLTARILSPHSWDTHLCQATRFTWGRAEAQCCD